MLGAILGDIIGSIYEGHNIKTKDFPLFSKGCTFTDDSVLTVSTMEKLLDEGDYAYYYKKYFRKYPDAGYGARFYSWGWSESIGPYNSFGNGSGMRVSPVAWYYDTLEEVLFEAGRSAAVTHSHPEGIKGAQTIAAAVFLARTHQTKEAIKEFIEERFGYVLDERLDDIRIWYRFDATSQGSVPQAIISFLESEDFEDAIRNAVSIGGDSDTIACMAGAIAEAAYGIPDELIEIALDILDAPLREVVLRFYSEVLGIDLLKYVKIRHKNNFQR